METTAAFVNLECSECGALHHTSTSRRCPECGSPLVAAFDFDGTDPPLDRGTLTNRRFDGLARYAELLPFPADAIPAMSEGSTPLVDCPEFADELGVGRVLVKDEGANPTGTTADRGMVLAVAAAGANGASTVALPTTGDGGHSAAAYAARAGLDSHAFVPSRSTFVAKAMTNVHGGEMTVVEGRYPDAVTAFEAAIDEQNNSSWHSVAPFDTPYRHEGAKTLLFEVVEQLDRGVPDHVVHPTGHGLGIVGSHLAAGQMRALDLVSEAPALHVTQPQACAPIAAAAAAGAADTDTWDRPDTLVGALEVPDPAGGALALDAIRETGGRAVDVADDEALEGAVTLAREGVGMSATGGVATAAARTLAADGRFGPDDTVVLVNPVASTKENDVLRSHLMRKGV